MPQTSRPLTVRTELPCLGITTGRGAAQSVYSRLLSATQERRFALPAYASGGVATVLGGATLGSLLVYALARRVGAASQGVGGAGSEPRTMGPGRRGWRLGRRSMLLSASNEASVSQEERTHLPMRGRAAGRESSIGARLWRGFTAPVDAVPVDLFRVLVGLRSSSYFLSAFREAELISAPEGLLDHALVQELFWYTRLGLFHPGMGLAAFRTIYALASAASLLLVIGVWIKPVSAGLFVLAVSTYRWNFPTTYVDDAIVHLMLLWVLLLPTGHTLTLAEWRAHRGAALARWKAARVPGAGVRCFLANLGLLYLVAALWKLTSPIWRDGFALYAVLKMAVSRAPEYWRPDHLPALRAATYAALGLELLCPFALILPARHALKSVLGVAMLGFHVGIIATMKIPFANVACIAAGVLVFRSEIMQAVRGGEPLPSSDEEPDTNLDLSARAAAVLVTLIALAMVSDMLRPRWRSGTHPVVRGNSAWAEQTPGPRQNPLYALLWCMGVVQSYRLFDLIDERNLHVRYDMVERSSGGQRLWLDDALLFPRTQRSVLLQSYLHDLMWIKVSRSRLPDFQRALFERYARRYCRVCGDSGPIEVYAEVQRITRDNVTLSRPQRVPFLSFTCKGGTPVLHFARLVRG